MADLTVSATIDTFMTSADKPGARSNLGLVIGTDVVGFNGAGGTPTSINLGNGSNYPVGSLSGLGSGVSTVLGIAPGVAGGIVTFNGALGTPTSGVATNLTGTAAGLTAGNVTTNANLTGVVTSVGNTTSLGSFTSAQLRTALTDESGTGAALFDGGTASALTIGLETISGNGAASTSPLMMTGAVFASGTGTTTFPYFFIQPTGVTPSTTWSTGGTIYATNLASGFAGNIFDYRINNTAVATLSAAGAMAISGTLTAGSNVFATTSVGVSNKSRMFSSADSSIEFRNNANSANSNITAANVTATGTLAVTGDVQLSKTITPTGTTGAQTINKNSGSVNFAAAATSLVVTNSLATTTSIIHVTVSGTDATMKGAYYSTGSGSFTIRPVASPTAETRVDFLITN